MNGAKGYQGQLDHEGQIRGYRSWKALSAIKGVLTILWQWLIWGTKCLKDESASNLYENGLKEGEE